MSSISISISEWLKETEHIFSGSGISTPRLDAEVLLAHALQVDRSWLHAHSDDSLTVNNQQELKKLVARRREREPIAYITGEKEFYGREFSVTPDVLIPRPETEGLIELAKATDAPLASIPLRFPQQRGDTKQQLEPSGVETKDGAKETKLRILDVGCGSGCIGITLKLENPNFDVTLADISPAALEVARRNAATLGAEVAIVESDLLMSLKDSLFDIVIANLPYVDRTWETSPETTHEPALALYADDDGLELIKKLIEQSSDVLNKQGLLFLEADPAQHEAIITFAANYGFKHQATCGYALSLMKQLQA